MYNKKDTWYLFFYQKYNKNKYNNVFITNKIYSIIIYQYIKGELMMGQKMPAFQINMNDISNLPRWYTIVTKTNYEYKFERDLKERMVGMKCENYIEEIFVPIKEELSSKALKSGKIKSVIKYDKIYPTYVFVKAIMNEQIWNLIRKTPGCATILAAGETLITMSDHEIDEIKSICTKINVDDFN